MKKQFLLILAISITALFSACSKSNSNPAAYVKVKINGNWVSFNVAVGELGPDLVDPSKTNLLVTANDDAQTRLFMFNIQSDHQIPTGTYNSNDPNYYIAMQYSKDMNTNNEVDYMIWDADGRAPSKFAITITSISDKEIKGTFTGNYLCEFAGSQTQEVTQGEFDVPRVP